MNKSNLVNIPEGLPARLRELRTKRKISRLELAKIVGIHENHIGRYERGDSQPTADKIKKMAEALGVSGDYLLDSTTEDVARASLEDRELLDLFKEVEKLTGEDRAVIKKLMTAFINQKKIHELSAK